jgi:hypothetical protein
MKILYVPTLSEAIAFWRIEPYANEMLKIPDVKIHVEYLPGVRENLAWDKMCEGDSDYSTNLQTRLESAFSVFDVIIFQRLQNTPGLELVKRLSKNKPKVLVLMDIDDSISHTSPSNPKALAITEGFAVSALQAQISDGCIASTEYIKTAISKLTTNTHIAPNCIQRDIWKGKVRRFNNKRNNYVYVGAGAHDLDIKIVYKPMLQFLSEDPKIRWKIYSGGPRPDWLKEHKQIEYHAIGWPIANYCKELNKLDVDIALAPLRDTEFNRCKSNLKWIEWSSMNVPVIASDVEPFTNTEGDIKLATDDWLEALRASRKWFPQDLHKQCLKNYDIGKETKQLLKWIEVNLKAKREVLTSVSKK